MTGKTSRRAVLSAVSGGVTLGPSVVTGGNQGSTQQSAGTDSGQSASASATWPMFQADPGNTGYRPGGSGPRAELRERWAVRTDRSVASGVAVTDGLVILGNGQSADVNEETGAVMALRADDGSEAWQMSEVQTVEATPAVVDGTVYVSSNDLVALNAADGTIQWRTGDALRPSGSAPAVVDGTVYVGAGDGRVHALDASDGTERWQSDSTDAFLSVAPAVGPKQVYISAFGTLHAFDRTTGQRQWQYQRSFGMGAPTVVDGTVYVGTARAAVSLNAQSGELLWDYTESNGFGTCSPVVAGDTVYVGSMVNLHALDRSTGTARWTADSGGTVTGDPTVVGDTIYFGSANGGVFGVDTDSGEKLLEYETGATVDSPVAVLDGTVYAGSNDQYVYALEESSPDTPNAEPTNGSETDSLDSGGQILPGSDVLWWLVALLAGLIGLNEYRRRRGGNSGNNRT